MVRLSKFFLLLVAVAIVSGFFGYFAWSLLGHVGHAREFSISQSIYMDQAKSRDLLVLYMFLALSAVGTLGLYTLAQRDFAVFSFETLPDSALKTLIAAIMSVLFVLTGVSVFIVAAFWAAFMCIRARDGGDVGQQMILIGIIASTLTLTLDNLTLLNLRISLSLSFLLLGIAYYFIPQRKIYLGLLGRLCCYILLLCLLSFAPFHWRAAANSFTGLDIAIYGTAAISLLSLEMACRRDREKEFFRVPAIFPGLVMTLLFIPEFNSFVLSNDAYHFGEYLISSIVALKNNPGLFDGLLPPHGFANAVAGILSALAGDETAGGVTWARIYIILIGQLFTATLIFALFRGQLISIGAALTVAIALIYSQTYLSVIPLLGILFVGKMKSNKIAGPLTVLIAAAAIFISGGVGIGVAISGYLIIAAYRLRRDGFKSIINFGLYGSFAGLLFIILFRHETIAWISYLLTSADTNLTLYGSAAGATEKPFWLSPTYGFLILPLIAGWFALGAYVRPDASNWIKLGHVVLLILPFYLFCVILNSYAFGRIDPTSKRALIVTLLGGILLIGFAAINLSRKSEQMAVLLSSVFVTVPIIMVGSTPWPSLLNPTAQSTLFPIFPSEQINLPDQSAELGLPRLGHVVMAENTKTDILRFDKIMKAFGPDVSVADLSNRSALFYYTDLEWNMRLSSAYNAAAIDFQHLVLEGWKDMPPDVFVVSNFNYEHDGYTLPLRSHFLYRYLITNFVPINLGEVVLGIRKDASPEILSSLVYSLPHYTDMNWTNGIANAVQEQKWSFFLFEPMAGYFNVGDVLNFSDGVSRTITGKSGLNFQVDGPPLSQQAPHLTFQREMPKTGNISSASFETEANLRDAWAKLFTFRNFNRLPSAWGRSAARLKSEMQPGSDVSLSLKGTSDVSPLAQPEGMLSSKWQITGPDPYWSIEFETPVDPRERGLLQFDLSCLSAGAVISAQVFWKSADEDFNEQDSIVMTLSHRRNIVPLDATPSWLLADEIIGLRLDLNSPIESCGAATLDNVILSQRNMEAFSEQ